MYDKLLLESCKLFGFANCEALDFSENPRSTLFLAKPLKLPTFLFQQLPYLRLPASRPC